MNIPSVSQTNLWIMSNFSYSPYRTGQTLSKFVSPFFSITIFLSSYTYYFPEIIAIFPYIFFLPYPLNMPGYSMKICRDSRWCLLSLNAAACAVWEHLLLNNMHFLKEAAERSIFKYSMEWTVRWLQFIHL